jgi:hypothetical protein
MKGEGSKTQGKTLLKTLKKYHKWPALVISLFLLLFAFSGIVLNHRDLFSSIDIDRKWLPSVYRYDNWNLASVKSSLEISEDSILIYGNIGIWLTDKNFSKFSSFSDGFPKGIDNRKIFTMLMTDNGSIYAGSLSGLYNLDRQTATWSDTYLPVSERRVVGMTQKDDSIFVMTRSNILVAEDTDNPVFLARTLPAAIDDAGTETLFRTLWLIHSGKIFGVTGKIIVDVLAITLIFLIFSGLLFFFTPKLLKRISGIAARSKLKRTNRWSIQWHGKLGNIVFIFLGLIATTGMFLRPPLLIPIAGTRVPVIKNSWLDNPNPWFDKLRDILWDPGKRIFLYSTSEGIYYSGPLPSGNLIPFAVQPPVSVMGINVFEKSDHEGYLTGSFSGIYRWIPEKGIVTDHITGQSFAGSDGLASPFGNVPVSGRLEYKGSEILFDYTRGAFSHHHGVRFPEMPVPIAKSSPISLWNLALEVHTGRIFFPLIGNWYILYIPVMGISTLVVLISGYMILSRRKRAKKTSRDEQTGLSSFR